MERRLAAILAADVVGYSQLMGRDETGTLSRLKACRNEILEPLIAKHNGRIVKLMGDGMLVEFASIVNAVSCAGEMQSAIAEHNASVPDHEPMTFRIGVNLGDLVIEGDDLYGDGVNIAARLESLAEPGGVCISGKVEEEIRGKVPLEFENLGAQQLKNIAQPVVVFKLAHGAGGMKSKMGPRRSVGASKRATIAVLPFDNMSTEEEQQYFSDGITEDIITELSRFASLEVVARNSTFVYRNKAVDVPTLGKTLGADFVLEGSLRKAANRVRLTAQLINVANGKHIWADRYDRDLEDIFAIQDELVHAIVTRLTDRLTSLETARSMNKPTDSLDAYDCYLRALNLDRKYTRECSIEAQALLKQAIELDPGFARAHALLSAQIWTTRSFDGDLREEDIAQAIELGQRAVELDPRDSSCHSSLAIAYLQARDFDRAGQHFELAISLNPHDSSIWSDHAWYLSAMGEHEGALALLIQREKIEPIPPDWHWDVRGHALYGLERWSEAIAAYERTRMLPVNTHAFLAACYGQLGNPDRAKQYWSQFRTFLPNSNPDLIRKIAYCAQPQDADRWREGLRKAGIT